MNSSPSQNKQVQGKFRTLNNELTIDFSKELGKGKYGKVYHAFPLSQYEKKQRYACKLIDVPFTQGDTASQENKKIKYLQEQFLHECEALTSIKSNHVISLIKSYKASQDRFYLITELCNGGDLQSLLHHRMKLDEEDAKIIMRQISEGLKDINDANYMHRDLKLANILLHFPKVDLLRLGKKEREDFIRNCNLKEVEFEIKISDLGFAKKINSQRYKKHTICGTLAYMPPDQAVKQDHNYSEKFDIWSLGVIFYELLTGRLSFLGKNMHEFKQNLKHGLYEFPESLKVSPEAIHLISKCLQSNEESRISINEIFDYPYLNYKTITSQENELAQANLSISSTSETLKQSSEDQKVGISEPSVLTQRKKLVLSANVLYSLDDIKDRLFPKAVHKAKSMEEEKLPEEFKDEQQDGDFVIVQPLTQAEANQQLLNIIPLNSNKIKRARSFNNFLKSFGQMQNFEPISENDLEDDIDAYPEDFVVDKCRDYEVIFKKLRVDRYFI